MEAGQPLRVWGGWGRVGGIVFNKERRVLSCLSAVDVGRTRASGTSAVSFGL